MERRLNLKKLFRSMSFPVGDISEPLMDGRRRILACGPQQALSCLKRTFDSEFKEESLTLLTSDIDYLMSMKFVWSKFLLPRCNAFILVFHTDDEDCYQAVSALKDVILENKGEFVPLLVVGFNRSVSSARIMCPLTADCVVTMDWQLAYTEATMGNAEELLNIFKELFKIIKQHETRTPLPSP